MPTITATYSGDSNNAGGIWDDYRNGYRCNIRDRGFLSDLHGRGNDNLHLNGYRGKPDRHSNAHYFVRNRIVHHIESMHVSSGSCTVTYKDTAVGTPTITATYSGNSNNAASHGNTIVTVNKATSTTSVSCPAFIAGGTTTCTATATGYNPTGTISMTPHQERARSPHRIRARSLQVHARSRTSILDRHTDHNRDLFGRFKQRRRLRNYNGYDQ